MEKPIESSKTIKRVALIRTRRTTELVYSFPVGLLSLASAIKEHGYEPVIPDFHLKREKKKNSPDFFRKIAERILGYGCDVLGFSALCSNLPVILLIAEECKKLAPQLPIILGGPEVSFEEVELMKTFGQVDIVVRSEGEVTLVEVLKALENKKDLSEVQGITYRDSDQIIRNPDRPFIEDLDQLPFLDYSFVPKLKTHVFRIDAGRGCPFACTFCLGCKMWKRHFRIKSPQRLAKELRDACRQFKNARIEIAHDHFLASRKFADEFLSLIANENLPWGCFTSLASLDESLIRKLKIADCRQILLGIESGSPVMQKKIKKNAPLSRLPSTLQLLSDNGIKAILYFIIGFPGETESQINETLLMALNSKSTHPSITINIPFLTFYKGSELHAIAKEEDGQYEYLDNTASPLTTDHPAEISLIKKYPRIFPSFYYIGNNEISPKILQKTSSLFYFLLRSHASLTLSLLEYLSVTPFQLGRRLISFFDAEGVDWSPREGGYYSHYSFPFKKFIRENASPLYKEFFWWEESREILEEKSSTATKET